jgi:DNA (cytosine-5)-methyltransferase 1
MKFIDFFAGIGGMRLGLEQAGHKCIGFCEFDKYAVKSYQAIHNTEGEWYSNDVRDIRAKDIPRADLWCFGFPCQDISVAGKQLGFDGKRSSLFFAVTRLIRDLEEKDRPSTLLVENVKNLLSVNGGVDFLKLQIELAEIGYDAEWQVLNSKDFGVPQNRERVFIIGHLRGQSGRKIFPLGSDGIQADDIQGQSPTTNTLTASYEGAQAVGSYVVEGEQYAQICEQRADEGLRFFKDGVCGTLRTIGACGDKRVIDGSQIRKLTPRECWRLQGFPDEYFNRAAAVNSDSQLYKQAGNAVTVNVARAIGQALAEGRE